MSEPNLAAFAPVYYINLDRSLQRREELEKALRYYGVEAQRIAAVDAHKDPYSYLIGDLPENMSAPELGCTLSHLIAIRRYLESNTQDYAIIIEDDLDFSTCTNWPFSFEQLLSKAPYNWDVLQLAIINAQEFIVNLHRRTSADGSTGCYVINRHYAEKLVRLHWHGEKVKIDQMRYFRPVADELIYNAGITYSIPLFNCKLALGSTIHDAEHLEDVHRVAYEAVKEFWESGVRHYSAETLLTY